jgi:hypothetical protein
MSSPAKQSGEIYNHVASGIPKSGLGVQVVRGR